MNSANYECKECHGSKHIKGNFSIIQICPVCNGKGINDWVEHAMGDRFQNHPATKMVHSMAMTNIQMLMHEIQRQGQTCGIHIDVKLNYAHYNEYNNFSNNGYIKYQDKIYNKDAV